MTRRYNGPWIARVGRILVVFGLIAGSGSEPLHTQEVGDQGRTEQQMLTGIRWGFGRDFDHGFPEGRRWGLVGGVDVAIPLSDMIELQIGGAYALKSYGVEVEAAESGRRPRPETVETSYLQWSALAKAGDQRYRGLSFGLLLGPWIAVALSCNHSDWVWDGGFLGIGGGFYRKTQSRPCDEFKRVDMGLAAGAGATTVSEGRWGLRWAFDVVYSFGLVTHPNLIIPGASSRRTKHLRIQSGIVIPAGG